MRAGRALLDSEFVIRNVGLPEGARVADFGCGRTGHVVLPAAKAVGEDGHVYAVDIVKKHLEMLEGLCQIGQICNLTTIWGDYERQGGVPLPTRDLDYIFLVNNLAVISSLQGLASEVRRLLKPDGKFVVIDWKKRLPHPVAPDAGRLMDLHDAELRFAQLGFKKIDEIPVSPTHWGFVLV